MQVFPTLAAVVTVSNLIVVTVFLKPNIRSYTSFLLTLIALSDVLNILCPSTVYLYFYTLGHYTQPVPFHLCRWAYYFGTVFRDVFNSLSLWLTVTLAYIRTRCIISPFTACEVHSKKNIALAIAAILAMAVLVHGPSLVAFDFIPIQVKSGRGEIYDTCHAVVSDVLGTCLLRRIHMWMGVIFSSFLPGILLIILNIRMLLSLRKAEHDRDLLHLLTPAPTAAGQNTFRTNNPFSQEMLKFEGYINDENKLYDDHTDGCVETADIHVDKRTPKSKSEMTEQRTSKFCRLFSINCIDTRMVTDRRLRLTSSTRSRDSAYERLHRESRRTTWYVLLVVTIICSHELPMAGLLCHTLLTHRGRLPPVLYGCGSIYLLLWQYLTYSFIFLVYCCMCSSFRSELRRTLTCGGCRGVMRLTVERGPAESVFTNPCSVRDHLKRRHRGDNSETRNFVTHEDDSQDIH